MEGGIGRQKAVTGLRDAEIQTERKKGREEKSQSHLRGNSFHCL